jgi:hypothetical protein
MNRTWKSLLAWMLFGMLISISGCSEWNKFGTPNWTHPGSEESQKAKAIRFDPYPDPCVGPAMEGVRPRSYDKPLPETQQARWELGDWGQQQ